MKLQTNLLDRPKLSPTLAGTKVRPCSKLRSTLSAAELRRIVIEVVG